MPPFKEFEREDRGREEVAKGAQELGVDILRAKGA